MGTSGIKQISVFDTVIDLVQGDITTQDVDAIVNAANSSLLGGGGVDGAIHRAAGPDLLAETRLLNGCKTGYAKITGGYKLKAKYVIHAVGPIYQSGDQHVAALLASAYHHSLELAVQHNIRTIAFPSLSTGAYGYPVDEAAPIALRAVYDFVREQRGIKRVGFILFSEQIVESYARALEKLAQLNPDIMKPL